MGGERHRRQVEHEVRDDHAHAATRNLRDDVHDGSRGVEVTSERLASVTTGLKWAPEIDMKARMSATTRRPSRWSSRAAATRCRSATDVGRRCPSRRHHDEEAGADRLRSRTSCEVGGQRQQQQRAADSGADEQQSSSAASRCPRARCRSPTARRRARRPTPCPAPRSSTATSSSVSAREALTLQANMRCGDGLGVVDLDAEVVERSGHAVARATWSSRWEGSADDQPSREGAERRWAHRRREARALGLIGGPCPNGSTHCAQHSLAKRPRERPQPRPRGWAWARPPRRSRRADRAGGAAQPNSSSGLMSQPSA